MTISIITPSYGQLDWLRMCIASVADQSAQAARVDESNGEIRNVRIASGIQPASPEPGLPAQPLLAIEHIVQDGGTPGMEDFAREVGGDLKSRYGGEFVTDLQPFEILHLRTESGYTLRVFREPDAGMYDAINKGIAKISGDLWAWLNSDEQYLPGTLASVAEWFGNHPDTDILCGDALLTDSDGNALSYRRIVRPLWHHTRLVHLSSLSCASFYRRAIVDLAGGFDTAWRSIGDAEWMARMMRAGVRIKACGKLFSTFAFTGQNTSETPLAGKEAALWRREADAPPEWLTLPSILIHRLRKFLAGAYRHRSVSFSIHGRGPIGRLSRSSDRLGWGWPSGGEFKHPEDLSEATYPVLGVSLSATDYKKFSGHLNRGSESGCGTIAVDFANTQIVTMRRHDPCFAALAESIDITVPDGMPLVWVMNRKGAALRDRVYGPAFTRKHLAACPPGKTHYLVGGSEECGRRFRERMLALNPSLEFVGGYHGPCSSEGVLEQDAEILEEIRAKRPDFIWVGLGTPKQYGWIARTKPQLDHGILLAVGFAFDVNAGMKADAPAWMQRLGLTWIHRMASEPRRLAGRYLKWNSLFLLYSAHEAISPLLRRARLLLRNAALRMTDLIASDIRDCVTGEPLGRGLVLAWLGRSLIIGHEGLPPLIPRFLPQRRLTYWKQSLGFTTHARPDYPRLTVPPRLPRSPSVMNLVLTHRGGESLNSMLEAWKPVCSPEDLWIAFGGSRIDFEAIAYPRKVFIDDKGLRRFDNQREKQSYLGIFRMMVPEVEARSPDFIYFCEYDHLPLVHDLNARQAEEMIAEDADVMGHWLYRVDGTGHFHFLYHETDPAFMAYWPTISERPDKGVILSMFGSGSMWRREAFLAVGKRPKQIDCYLELYLPSLAHHLGYRVRGWNEDKHLISNLPSKGISVAEGMRLGCLTVHPVKK